jgi:peptidoglycan/LPS O-acetylase OafA/YrhL
MEPIDPARSSIVKRDREGGRLIFVDVMRVVAIVLVIAHHAGQPYGIGGEWAVNDPASTAWLEPFFRVNAAFGMGFMFLLAGFFVPRAYDRRGSRQFLRERWKRIGVPLVAVLLLVNVPITYLFEDGEPSLGEFVRSMYETGLQSPYFHLWFLGHLLLYSVGYVLLRKITERRVDHRRPPWSLPTNASIVWFVIGLALVTWIVRGWFPINRWFPIVFVVASEPAHLPQYISLFAIGCMAYRGDWLRRMQTRLGVAWLTVGLVASAGLYALVLLAPERSDDLLANGGFDVRSLLFSLWEALICVGLCLGLLILGRLFFRRTNRLIVALAAASYAAYILHLVFVVTIQLAITDIDLPATVKFLFVTVSGIALSFGLAHLSGRVPGLRNILGTAPPPRKSNTTQEVSQ